MTVLGLPAFSYNEIAENGKDGKQAMSDFSTQQRLQLKRQVRERYWQDRQDLGQREQLLYGRPLSYFGEEPSPDYDDGADWSGMGDNPGGSGGTLGLRILLAAILVCLLALADHRGDTLFGMNSSQIMEYLRYDYISAP